MRRFLVITERANGNYSAYSPDLPGCVATGETRDDAEEKMHEAVGLHLRGMIEDGEPVPESHSFASFISVP